MNRKRSGAIRRRLGPIGLSLLASALTAAGFAAFSIADSGGGSDNNGPTTQVLIGPAPGADAGERIGFAPNLSAADRRKMEEFHQCMQDNGAPEPPAPGDFDPSNPPKPPSTADQQAIEKAWEACKDKLPEDLQKAGPPKVGVACGPPPGVTAPGAPRDQKNEPFGQSSGSGS